MADQNDKKKMGTKKNFIRNYGSIYKNILVRLKSPRKPESGDIVHFGYPKSSNEKKPYYLLIHDDGTYWTGITLNWISPKDLVKLASQMQLSIRTSDFSKVINQNDAYDLYHAEIKRWMKDNGINAWRQYFKSEIVSPTIYYVDRNAIDKYLR